LWNATFDANGNLTGRYRLTTTGQIKAFSVSRDSSNDPEIFAIGLDDQVYAQRFNALGISISAYSLTSRGQVLYVDS
jgi:hypothetical protein